MNSKTYLSYSSALRVFSFLILSIGVISCRSSDCENDYISVYEQARQGDLATVKAFVEAGGDIHCECRTYKYRKLGSLISVSSAVIKSGSKELMTYALTINNGETKGIESSMLTYAIKNDDREFMQFLIQEHEALLMHSVYANIDLEALKALHSAGYDFNKKSLYGAFLPDYLANGPHKKEEVLLEEVKYLVSVGVDVNLVDEQGKSAADWAREPQLKAYLEGLMDH